METRNRQGEPIESQVGVFNEDCVTKEPALQDWTWELLGSRLLALVHSWRKDQ